MRIAVPCWWPPPAPLPSPTFRNTLKCSFLKYKPRLIFHHTLRILDSCTWQIKQSVYICKLFLVHFPSVMECCQLTYLCVCDAPTTCNPLTHHPLTHHPLTHCLSLVARVKVLRRCRRRSRMRWGVTCVTCKRNSKDSQALSSLSIFSQVYQLLDLCRSAVCIGYLERSPAAPTNVPQERKKKK